MEHIRHYFETVRAIAESLDLASVDRLTNELVALRERGGRLFLVGMGGSAANCSHATNDFRKLCGIEAYAPVDNVSELTARANDEGLDTIFTGWLSVSRARAADALLVFSVGGGDVARHVSANIVAAVDMARDLGMTVLGVVGRKDGHTATVGDAVVVVPPVDPSRITPHSEAFQAVIWHCLVSDPRLQVRATKW